MGFHSQWLPMCSANVHMLATRVRCVWGKKFFHGYFFQLPPQHTDHGNSGFSINACGENILGMVSNKSFWCQATVSYIQGQEALLSVCPMSRQ